ncbi:lysophospholipase [Streptomyces sp. NBC_00670]
MTEMPETSETAGSAGASGPAAETGAGNPPPHPSGGPAAAPGTPSAPLPSALRLTRDVADPRAAVLLLHGGRADGLEPVPTWDPAALRMWPFARAIRRATPADARVLLGSVVYRHRGWNGTRADPARDAERALAELNRLHPEVPVVLVGHSMGGRAALRAAEHPRVSGVLALAPWCPPGEPVAQLRERTVLILHGDRDRVTDPQGAADLARRAGEAGARARLALIDGGEHAMLRRAATWHRLAATAVTALLDPDPGHRLPPPFDSERPTRV